MKLNFYTKYDRQGASSRYRTYQYQPEYRSAGLSPRCLPMFSDEYLKNRYQHGRWGSQFFPLYQKRWEDMKRIGDCDLAVVEKELLPYLPAALERNAFREAPHILLDYDDAIFANYQHHPNPVLRMVLRNKISQLMGWADGVIGGSRYLCDYASQYARKVWFVPTTVDVSRYQLHEHDHDGLITIGWIGTPWSARYLPVIHSALRSVAQEVSLRFLVVGADSPFGDEIPSQSLPWSEDREAELVRWMDIGVMPLVDSPFERGKCGLKLLQYMACGVVPVASDVGGNKDIINHGVDGFICRCEEEWIECLLELSRNPSLRMRMGAAAREKVEQEYSLSTWGPRLLSIYQQVAGKVQAA